MSPDAPASTPTTRAVTRQIEAGRDEMCTGCSKPIRWRATNRARQVIANVYKRRSWDHVEHWHEDCYTTAGAPHGAADTSTTRRPIEATR